MHVGGQFFDRFGLVDRIRIDGIGVENGLADVAQRLVHGVSKGVDDGWLMVARNDSARAAMAG